MKTGRPIACSSNHRAHLLHQRIAPIVERHRIHHPGLRRSLAQHAALAPHSAPAACPRSHACPPPAPPGLPADADDSASCYAPPPCPDRRSAPPSCHTRGRHHTASALRSAEPRLDPAIATTSTSPSRRTASMCCAAIKPGPTNPIPIRLRRLIDSPTNEACAHPT